MKAENNFLAFFISLLQREVRNLSTKSACGRLQFQLPGSLHRRKHLENIGARLTGTTSGHQLPPPAQCKPESCLQEFVPQRDSSPPTTWPTLQRVVTSGWTQTRLSQRPDCLKEFSIWRAQVMGELNTRAEPLQLLMTPGLGWIPAPLPGNGRSVSPQCSSPDRKLSSESAPSHLFEELCWKDTVDQASLHSSIRFSQCGYEERKERNRASWFRTNSFRHAFPTAFNKMSFIFL